MRNDFLTAAALVAALAPAMARAGPIDGRWSLSLDPKQCHGKVGELDAPAVIRNHRLDRYEARCDWRQLTAVGPRAWTAPGRCVAEGVETRGTVRFERVGDGLVVTTPDAAITRLRHCPG